MNKKILTAISVVVVFMPWTILPLRENAWALKPPIAEIIISCYAVFMVFGGIFTAISYLKVEVQNSIMKVCLIINSIYAVGGIVVFIMMGLQKMM